MAEDSARQLAGWFSDESKQQTANDSSGVFGLC